MINLNLEGGLCNRLRTMESGMRLSFECGAPITFYWQYHPFAMRMYFTELFEPIARSEVKIIEYRHITPYKRWLFSRFNPRRFRFNEYNDLIKFCMAGNANKHWVAHSNYAEFYVKGNSRDYSWLKPLPYIQDKVDSELTNLGNDYVGIHIRRTDNIWSIRNSPFSLFKNRIMAELDVNKEAKFFLATDDEETRQCLLSEFPDVVYTRRNVAERNSNGGVADAVVDLMLLASSKMIFGSFGSSFSVVASQIGNIPLEVLTIDASLKDHDERLNWEHPQNVYT